MARKIRLSDGRVIDSDKLGKIENGLLVDFSPLQSGGTVRALDKSGEWVTAGDITGRGSMGFEPLAEKDLDRLEQEGILKFCSDE